MPAIKPTVGRVVHFFEHDPPTLDAVARLDAAHGREPPEPVNFHREPQAAIIAKVHDDGSVNLMTIQPSGNTQARSNVLLVQDGDKRPKDRSYCAWMPYQVGQAAKTEQLEKQLAKQEEAPIFPDAKPPPAKPKPTAPASAKPPAQPPAA